MFGSKGDRREVAEISPRSILTPQKIGECARERKF